MIGRLRQAVNDYFAGRANGRRYPSVPIAPSFAACPNPSRKTEGSRRLRQDSSPVFGFPQG